MGAKRIRHLGQRLIEVFLQQILIGQIARHFAQTVHIIGKRNQACRTIGEYRKRMAHHARARNLAKGSNMRQTRGTIACLK